MNIQEAGEILNRLKPSLNTKENCEALVASKKLVSGLYRTRSSLLTQENFNSLVNVYQFKQGTHITGCLEYLGDILTEDDNFSLLIKNYIHAEAVYDALVILRFGLISKESFKSLILAGELARSKAIQIRKEKTGDTNYVELNRALAAEAASMAAATRVRDIDKVIRDFKAASAVVPPNVVEFSGSCYYKGTDTVYYSSLRDREPFNITGNISVEFADNVTEEEIKLFIDKSDLIFEKCNYSNFYEIKCPVLNTITIALALQATKWFKSATPDFSTGMSHWAEQKTEGASSSDNSRKVGSASVAPFFGNTLKKQCIETEVRPNLSSPSIITRGHPLHQPKSVSADAQMSIGIDAFEYVNFKDIDERIERISSWTQRMPMGTIISFPSQYAEEILMKLEQHSGITSVHDETTTYSSKTF